MADGQDGKFEDVSKLPAPPDIHQNLLKDAQPEMPTKQADVVAQGDAASQANAPLDVSKEGKDVQARFADGPQAGLEKSHEAIANHVASLKSTEEGSKLLDHMMKENAEFYKTRNPQMTEVLHKHQ